MGYGLKQFIFIPLRFPLSLSVCDRAPLAYRSLAWEISRALVGRGQREDVFVAEDGGTWMVAGDRTAEEEDRMVLVGVV